MKELCSCQKVLLVLGAREMDINEQIWPQVRSRNISWTGLKLALDQLVAKGLITKAERKVEGSRIATFYMLTSAGQAQKSLILSGEERKNGSASVFEGNCCLNKAA